MRKKIPAIGKVFLNPLLLETLRKDAHHHSQRSKMGLPSSNLNGLNGAIAYFTKLRDSGQVSDEVCQALIAKACAVYVDTEVRSRVETMIAKRLSPDKIVKFLS